MARRHLFSRRHLSVPSCRSLLQIRFSTKSFGVEAAEVAARAIENVAGTLVDADMSDIIAGRPGEQALLVERAYVCGGLVRVYASLKLITP